MFLFTLMDIVAETPKVSAMTYIEISFIILYLTNLSGKHNEQ